MKKYSRLSKQERYLIENGVKANKSRRKIAELIGRPPKTVSAEISRNGGYLRYYAEKAHYKRTRSNRKGYSKIDSNKKLSAYIRNKLLQKWSPEVIAGRWNKDHPKSSISHEAIYQWIYDQDNKLYRLLPRRKKKRRFKPQRKKDAIMNRTSIHQRAEHINNRSESWALRRRSRVSTWKQVQEYSLGG